MSKFTVVVLETWPPRDGRGGRGQRGGGTGLGTTCQSVSHVSSRARESQCRANICHGPGLIFSHVYSRACVSSIGFKDWDWTRLLCLDWFDDTPTVGKVGGLDDRFCFLEGVGTLLSSFFHQPAGREPQVNFYVIVLHSNCSLFYHLNSPFFLSFSLLRLIIPLHSNCPSFYHLILSFLSQFLTFTAHFLWEWSR